MVDGKLALPVAVNRNRQLRNCFRGHLSIQNAGFRQASVEGDGQRRERRPFEARDFRPVHAQIPRPFIADALQKDAPST